MKELLTISMILLFIGCANKLIELDKDFLHPAEYNLLQYKTLAMGDIEYVKDNDSLIAKDIQDYITSSIIKSEKFELVDRKNLGSIISEQILSTSGLINQESAIIIGDVIGAGVLITGRISQNKYDENIKINFDNFMPSVYRLNLLTAVYSLVNIERNRIGDYFLTFDIKFIDLNSAAIVYAKTFQFESQEITKGSLITRPDKINPYNLYINCLRQLDTEFIKTIAPYNEDRIVGFIKHKSLPEIKNATKFLSIGENDDAIRMFQEMIKGKDLNSKSISIAYYNLSKAYLFNDEYDLAIKVLQDGLINTPNARKENIIEENWDSYTNEIKLYKELTAKLEEQIKAGEKLEKEHSKDTN